MTATALLEEARQLSVAERVELVGDLWDTILPEQDQLPLSDAHRKVLDERMARYRENPNEGSSWEEVRARLLSS
jgi:putative addiction module component (TIGR02574 family)